MVTLIVRIAFINLQEKKLKSHQKICENEYFHNVLMPSEDTKILKFIKNLIKHHLLFMQVLSV